MGIVETFVDSVKIMLENKVRSVLTMLGIIVGISSLIMITILGNSFYDTFTEITSTLYKNNQAFLSIVPTDTNGNVNYDEYGNVILPDDVYFDTRDVDEFLSMDICGDSYVALGTTTGVFNCSYMDKTARFALFAANAEEVSYTDFGIVKGRDISLTDINNSASTAVIPDVVANYFFGDSDPIGQEIIINGNGCNIPVIIVGVYKYFSELPGDSVSQVTTLAFVNRTYIENRFNNLLDNTYFHRGNMNLMIKNVDDTEALRAEAEKYFNQYLDVNNWETDVQFRSDSFNTIEVIVDIVIKIISVIACIALLIGGIGVMNVMLVTVTERTNEIGIRKAIGASNSSILFQFLTESFTISFSGTVLGLIFGFVTAKILSVVAVSLLQSNLGIPININVSVSWGMIAFSVGISLLIGVVFGIYPAYRATKMQVVDALRYE
ncbi:MAG: ABC transporter permease [Acutalibacteraceae bacterium]|nr:ABC transporter permease [Acutalibacteraceae bacterium]